MDFSDGSRCLAGVDAALFGNRLGYDFFGKRDEFGFVEFLDVAEHFLFDLQYLRDRMRTRVTLLRMPRLTKPCER